MNSCSVTGECDCYFNAECVETSQPMVYGLLMEYIDGKYATTL